MPIVKLKPIHNRLLDLLAERVNKAQAELFNEVQMVLADLGVPPGSYDPHQILRTREVNVAEPQPVEKTKPKEE